MILSPGRGYIFVHIPKTGGTSLARALEARAKADDILIGDTPKAQRRKRRLAALTPRGRLWKHSTLADIDGILTPDEIAAMFTFTLVRNPWDRMVSYYHWARAQSFDHPTITLARDLGFGDFLRHPTVHGTFAANPYASYMRDITGTERARAYLRLEHLDADLAPLSAHLGFDLDLPHDNASVRDRDYRRYYDDDLAEVVATICADDIARFGYQYAG